MNTTRTQWMNRAMAAALAVGLAGLVSCNDPPIEQERVITRPAERREPASLPKPGPVAIKLEKPRMLGPLTPAIVVLPARFPEPMIRVRLTPESAAQPVVKKGVYRGKVETVRLANGKFVVINTLPLDMYLQGVLAKEMYGSWDIEAFKAQAIAARTYAVYQILTEDGTKAWDVTNDESSQMYGGIAGETAKSRQAVTETRGQVMLGTYGDQKGVFSAFYSACNGGGSQDPFDAWGDYSLGVLSAKKTGDLDAACPKFRWPTMVVSRADLSRCVKNWGDRNQLAYLSGFGEVRRVSVTKRNATTGRPVEWELTNASGLKVPMRAEELRLALMNDPLGQAPRPFSSWFDVQPTAEGFALVNGRGYGHGIGMSQWGAQALAKSGKSHKYILSYFYMGMELRKLW